MSFPSDRKRDNFFIFVSKLRSRERSLSRADDSGCADSAADELGIRHHLKKTKNHLLFIDCSRSLSLTSFPPCCSNKLQYFSCF
jgi:hypothetical protein